MDPICILSGKDQEIYKKVARFVYSQGLASVDDICDKCLLFSFEAWKIVNVLVAVGVLKEESGVCRVWGSPASSEFFDAIVDEALADVDSAILNAAEMDSRDDIHLERMHRQEIVMEMMANCPGEFHKAHVEISEMIFRGHRKSAILDACDRLGVPETGVWLSTRLEPVPPSEKEFVS